MIVIRHNKPRLENEKGTYRIAGNIDEDFNLTLWRFKHQIAKDKTVKKSRGLIKFAIHCVPFIAHHCWRVKENIGSGGVAP